MSRMSYAGKSKVRAAAKKRGKSRKAQGPPKPDLLTPGDTFDQGGSGARPKVNPKLRIARR